MSKKDPNLLLVYDIPDDRKRTKIADACLDYGLDRIQFSSFLGWLLPTQQEELFLKVKKLLGKKHGNIQMFPICADDWQKRKIIDQTEGIILPAPVPQAQVSKSKDPDGSD